MNKLRKIGIVLIAVVLVVVGMPLPSAQAAVMAAIETFHATCTSFSVDVTVSGVTEDQNGFDRFRFEVTDGTGKVLYREDSARQVGVTDRALVVGLPYNADGKADGAPHANPIRFSVIDLDILARPVREMASTTFESTCFVGAAPGVRLADLLKTGVEGTITRATALYPSPNADALPLNLPQGARYTALYITPDAAWTALYVGGEDLVWIPSAAIGFADGSGPIRVLPDRIDRSQQVTSVLLPGAPIATSRALYNVNIRDAASSRGKRLGRVPFSVTVPVYGRSADSGWLLITYNGISGWAAARFFVLNEMRLSELPIVR